MAIWPYLLGVVVLACLLGVPFLIKRQKGETRGQILVCPRCGSENIWDRSESFETVVGPARSCSDCGFNW